MFVNVSQETLNDIPPDSQQIILVNSNASTIELYNAILNTFLEEGYRVSVNLEDKLVLGTDFDLNRDRNISGSIHRIDVSIKESADGVIAVFTCEFIKASNSLFGEYKSLGKKAQWNKNTEESYYFAIMLEFAQKIPSSKISYSLPLVSH